MWKIREVKEKGKWAFKRNYWKAVIVSLLVSLFLGGGMYSVNYSKDFQEGFQEGFNEGIEEGYNKSGYDKEGYDKEEQVDLDLEEEGLEGIAIVIVVLVIVIIVFIFVAIILAISLTIDALIFNPIELGLKGFFLKNINKNANVRDLLMAFDTASYKNMVKVLFFRDLHTVLWTLLFIIPGIVKKYEYSMIPYLLAENPEMSKEEAFAESKRLMKGNKWHAFLLDLSFIGWFLLSIPTLGIINVFYVTPYRNSVNAVLYETLKYGNGNVVSSQYGM